MFFTTNLNSDTLNENQIDDTPLLIKVHLYASIYLIIHALITLKLMIHS